MDLPSGPFSRGDHDHGQVRYFPSVGCHARNRRASPALLIVLLFHLVHLLMFRSLLCRMLVSSQRLQSQRSHSEQKASGTAT